MKNRVAAVKALLLDQSIVAGVGNIYADEALFRGIDPRRAGGDLKDAEIERLWQSVRAVLQMGIELRGSSLGSGPQNYTPPDGEPGAAQASHQVFRRTGCPVLCAGRLWNGWCWRNVAHTSARTANVDGIVDQAPLCPGLRWRLARSYSARNSASRCAAALRPSASALSSRDW
ncbi:MAG: hypothetical protein R2856_17240 [Caldilineaceae bacterium]